MLKKEVDVRKVIKANEYEKSGILLDILIDNKLNEILGITPEDGEQKYDLDMKKLSGTKVEEKEAEPEIPVKPSNPLIDEDVERLDLLRKAYEEQYPGEPMPFFNLEEPKLLADTSETSTLSTEKDPLDFTDPLSIFYTD